MIKFAKKKKRTLRLDQKLLVLIKKCICSFVTVI